MTVYYVWRNKILITITGSFWNLVMLSGIENIIFDPKSWAINLYNGPSFGVYIETKKWRYFSVLEESVFRRTTICL